MGVTGVAAIQRGGNELQHLAPLAQAQRVACLPQERVASLPRRRNAPELGARGHWRAVFHDKGHEGRSNVGRGDHVRASHKHVPNRRPRRARVKQHAPCSDGEASARRQTRRRARQGCSNRGDARHQRAAAARRRVCDVAQHRLCTPRRRPAVGCDEHGDQVAANGSAFWRRTCHTHKQLLQRSSHGAGTLRCRRVCGTMHGGQRAEVGADAGVQRRRRPRELREHVVVQRGCDTPRMAAQSGADAVHLPSRGALVRHRRLRAQQQGLEACGQQLAGLQLRRGRHG